MTARVGASRTAGPRRAQTLLRAGVDALPDRVPILLFWAGLVVSVTVILGAFCPLVVLPAVVVLAAVTWRLMPTPLPATRATTVGSVAAFVVALGWVAVNAPYAARYVVVSRDPGFLALGGLWLSDNPGAVLPADDAYAVADAVAGGSAGGAGMAAIDGDLYLQGAKLLPGLLAALGWVGGDTAVLAGNLVIGAVALIAVYALTRRLVGPVWGLVPVAALAASIPMTAFSRATYTEPLSLALAFGGLAVAWSAFRARDLRLHALGAAMIGATALVRIDGGATAVGLIAGYGLVAGATILPIPRVRALLSLGAVIAVSLVTLGLGYLDLRTTSPRYLADLGPQYRPLLGAFAASIVAALVLALPTVWRPVRSALLTHRRRIGVALGGLTGVVALALFSRPLWLISRHGVEGSNYSNLVGALQRRDELGIDPTRTYDEQSVTWLAWYLGWPAVVLGFAGLALAVAWAVKRRDPRWLIVAAVVGAPSALYLWRVSITPDQIWGVRRFLPVTIPGLLVLATVAVAALWHHRSRWVKGTALLAAGAVVVAPVLSWRGDLFTTVEQGGRWTEAQRICDALPSDKVVVVQAPSYVPTVRVVCDVQVVAFSEPVTPAHLAAVREEWGDDVSVLTFVPDNVSWADDAAPPPTLASEVFTWEIDLDEIPGYGVRTISTAFVGAVAPDGTVVPVGVTP